MADKNNSRESRSARRRGAVFVALLVAVLFVGLPRPAARSQTSELHVAAAADLQPVFPAIAAAYQKAAGVKLVPSFGSSAMLTQQLLNGAPHDVFLSADFVHPQQLVEARLATTGPVAYARGTLVLWARSDSPAQPLAAVRDQAHALDTLARPSVVRVAAANPEHAPYGQAAVQALKALGAYDKLAPKLVLGENVSQTAQFALSGNAQAAFISLTSANSPAFRAAGSFVTVPVVYPEIRQCGVVLKQSPHRAAAEAFLRWLTSPEVQKTFSGLGLSPAR